MRDGDSFRTLTAEEYRSRLARIGLDENASIAQRFIDLGVKIAAQRRRAALRQTISDFICGRWFAPGAIAVIMFMFAWVNR